MGRAHERAYAERAREQAVSKQVSHCDPPPPPLSLSLISLDPSASCPAVVDDALVISPRVAAS